MAEKHILKYPNGATLIYYQQNINDVTDITVGFNGGASCDEGQAGKAHAVEHCFFHGTKDLPKEELYKIFKNTSTKANAETSQDYVNITMDMPNSQFSKMAKIMSDMITNDQINEKEWIRERKVILQEAYMTADDDEEGTKAYSFLIDHNKTYMKGRDLLGDEKSLSEIKTQDLLDYKKKYFVTENMIVSVVSRLPFEEVKKIVEENFINKIPSKPENKVEIQKRRYRFASQKIINDKPAQDSFNIVFMFKGLQDNEKNDLYTVFEDWYFNEFSGKMYKKLRLENPLVYYTGFDNLDLVNLKLKYFHVITSPECVNQCIDCLTKILREAIVEGISEEEFEEFKQSITADRERKSNLKIYNSDDLYYDYIHNEKIFVPKFYEKLNKLTREDINNYLKRIYVRSKVAVYLEGNVDKAENKFDFDTNPFNVMTDEAIDKEMSKEVPIYSIDEIIAKYNPIEEFKQKCYEPTLVNVTDGNYYDMPESFKDQIRKLKQAQEEDYENEFEEEYAKFLDEYKIEDTIKIAEEMGEPLTEEEIKELQENFKEFSDDDGLGK